MTKLLTHLMRSQRNFINIKEDASYVPTPAEMLRFLETRLALQKLHEEAAGLGPLLWERIDHWRRTPWTTRQKIMRIAKDAAGSWVCYTLGFAVGFFGWFLPQPQLWLASGITGLILIGHEVYGSRRER